MQTSEILREMLQLWAFDDAGTISTVGIARLRDLELELDTRCKPAPESDG